MHSIITIQIYIRLQNIQQLRRCLCLYTKTIIIITTFQDLTFFHLFKAQNYVRRIISEHLIECCSDKVALKFSSHKKFVKLTLNDSLYFIVLYTTFISPLFTV